MDGQNTQSLPRRDFLKRLSVTAAASLALPGLLAQTPRKGPLPNIVWILSDDQGWGDYSFMGHSHIATPHIDKLSREGVTFTRGYVAAPLCCPSLAAMITGFHPHQNKRTSNDPPRLGKARWTAERLALREQMITHVGEARTLPRLLAPLGYVSMQTGKWWEGHHNRGGFTHGMTHGDPKKGGRHGDVGLTIGRQTMQPVYDFIDGAVGAKKPFFLWYAPMMPHSPHNPPDRLFRKYQPKTPSPHIARYWAMCEWFDETCGRLLDYLDNKALRENTVVIYICDNGWIQRENSPRHAGRSKLTSYEGGIRTPVMVRWPGHVTPRRDDATLVSAVDMMPTSLAACGLKPGPDMQGADLLDSRALASRKAVFGAGYGHDAVDVNDPAANLYVRWVLEGRWKLLSPFRRNRPRDIVELFDVLADPHEERNVALEHRDIVDRLAQRINVWWPLEDSLPPKFESRPPETIAFEFAVDPAGWSQARDISALRAEKDGLAITARGDDPIIVISPCNIDPEPTKRVRVRLSATAGKMVEFRWGTEEFGRIDPGKLVSVPLQADGKPHEYVFEVGRHPDWRGERIKRLRFDPGDAKGTFKVYWMRGEP